MRYRIRIIIIFIFTLLLLWYSGQKNNNPFAGHSFIKISLNPSFFYLSCHEKSNRLLNNTLLFILTSYHPGSGEGETEKFKFPKTSLLFTRSNIPVLTENFIHPPSKWIIVDTLKSNKNSTGTVSDVWPEPLYSMNFSIEGTVALRPVFPFADTTMALQFSFNSIDILILNRIPDRISTEVSSLFRERYSIIINCIPYRYETVQKIQRLFRPLYLVILPLNAEEVMHTGNRNGIVPVEEKNTLVFYMDSGGAVQLK